MLVRIVEYGRYETVEYSEDVVYPNVERSIVTGLVIGVGISSLLSGGSVEGALILSTLPMLWYQECAPLISNLDWKCIMPDFYDEDDITTPESTPEPSPEPIVPDESFNDKVDDMYMLVPCVRERAVMLAERMGGFRTPNIGGYDPKEYQDLNDSKTYKRLLQYLNKRISGCRLTECQELLESLDSRLYLKVVNYKYVMNPPQQMVTVPVKVHDPAWLGLPTLNTQIVCIDEYLKDIQEFQYISDYSD